ncbi:hypothetical protein IWQ62_003461 [Dispira parvispora]|uniref:C2H2-type domain-containing protein n=1 Tax=Dispira parvispora TaxID=1520584 RepID=A0A9W8AU14_9FUNG|nr:hypothetical protein IWQ62_003461 [Dispira parvispora]
MTYFDPVRGNRPSVPSRPDFSYAAHRYRGDETPSNSGRAVGPGDIKYTTATWSPHTAHPPQVAAGVLYGGVGPGEMTQTSQGNAKVLGTGPGTILGQPEERPSVPHTKEGVPSLQCETCGNRYARAQELQAHRWEHTPEWDYSGQFATAVHSRVELLEAAQVLHGLRASPTSPVHTAQSSSQPRLDYSPVSPPPGTTTRTRGNVASMPVRGEEAPQHTLTQPKQYGHPTTTAYQSLSTSGSSYSTKSLLYHSPPPDQRRQKDPFAYHQRVPGGGDPYRSAHRTDFPTQPLHSHHPSYPYTESYRYG